MKHALIYAGIVAVMLLSIGAAVASNYAFVRWACGCD